MYRQTIQMYNAICKTDPNPQTLHIFEYNVHNYIEGNIQIWDA